MNKQRYAHDWRIWLVGLWLVALGAALVYGTNEDRLYALGSRSAPAAPVRFAIIGDFGVDQPEEAAVSTLVKGWSPDLILTVGDNNYPDGAAATIDANIGQYYHDYIFPYTGTYGTGATENRFFPALGNHDWHTITCVNAACGGAYFDYFTLPGNERYYEFVRGPVHFFIIDSDKGEPDGITADSAQAAWLQAQLAASTVPWQFVFLHHAPYSSSTNHGSQPRLQWPYGEWGADAVFAGHDHLYERVVQNGIPYFVNGAGGANLYTCGPAVPGSQLCYDGDHGAMLVTADEQQVTLQFFTRTGQLIDTHTLHIDSLPTPTLTATATATPRPGITVKVSQSGDDAEERVDTGNVSLTSGDLELVNDPTRGVQVVGLRFPNLLIPRGITITNAYLEFTVDETNVETTTLVLRGEAVDNAQAYTTTAFNLSVRPQTVMSVTWAEVPPWESVGGKQRTPNLASILQEIINRPGWNSGNALALQITGSGQRTAKAYDGDALNSPWLRVEYPGAPTPTATPSLPPIKTPTPVATVPGQQATRSIWLPVVRR